MKLFFKLLFLLVGICLIVLLGYFLGFDILLGHTGNDAPNALTFVTWIDKYFPWVPYWFPLQGAGISFIQGYNTLVLFLVVIFKRLTNFSLLEVFNLLLFLSPILTALVIYLWVWWRFRSQVMGLLAGIFYLLMPVSWVFITEWGFYNEALSYLLVPPTLAFFDFYLVKKRFWALLLAGILFSLVVLAQLHAWFFLVLLISFYGLLRKNLAAVFLVGLVVFLLSAFWLIPFFSYNQLATRGMSVGLLSREEISNMILPLGSLLGLSRIPEEDFQYSMRNAAVSPLIWGLALVGFLLAIFQSKKIFALGLFFLFESIYSLNIEAVSWVSYHLTLLLNLLSLRVYLFSVRFILPVMAAYGLVGSVNLAFSPLKKWLRGVVPLLAGGTSLLLAAWLIFIFATLPRLEGRGINYGPDFAGENLNLVWEKRNQIDRSQAGNKDYWRQLLEKKEWPLGEQEAVSWLIEKLPKKDNLRIDFSGKLGGMVQRINIFSHQLSQVSLYTFSLFINRPLWGYQQAVFYFQEEPYQSAKPLNEVANLYGIQYVVVNSERDPVYKYQESGWELFAERGKTQIWYNPGAPELAELTSRPTALVIGNSQQNHAYEQILRLANLGGLSWQEAFLVNGRQRIDAYRLEELVKFDLLILHGYSYKNSDRAWKLMEDYLNQGGRVYLETGWQYMAADWEMEEVPPILPFESLSWQNIGQTQEFNLAGGFEDEIKIDKFDPLVWEDKGWGFSSFEKGKLRDWGEVTLSVRDYPLVVKGEKGQGRIVWSGMNLPAHATRNQNAEEVKFFHELMVWLTEGRERENYSLRVNRPYPDKVEFTIDQTTSSPTWLFWRESYHPHWQAKRDMERLKVYEAGPGLILINLPPVSEGTKVTLWYQTPISYWLARITSLISLVVIVFFAFSGRARERLADIALGVKRKMLTRVKKDWEEEEY